MMRTRIHVLCSNFREIGRREVPQMTRCFSDKKVFVFSPPSRSRWTAGAEILRATVPPKSTFPLRLRLDRLSFAGVMSGKLRSTRRTTAIYAFGSSAYNKTTKSPKFVNVVTLLSELCDGKDLWNREVSSWSETENQ